MKNKNIQVIVDGLNKDNKFIIAFLGDSITSQEWVHPNWREIVEYVLKMELDNYFNDFKKNWWKLHFVNLGFNGCSTQDVIEMMEDHILCFEPNLTLFMLGDNDMYMNISPSMHKKNIENILDSITQSGAEAILMSAPFTTNEEHNKKYEKYLAEEKSLFPKDRSDFLNMYEEHKKFNIAKFYTFVSEENVEAGIKEGDIDFLHQNTLGNAYIAKVILEKIFDIQFNPEKYLKSLGMGEKYPEY